MLLLSAVSGWSKPAAETNSPAWPPSPAAPCIVYVRDIAAPKDIGVKAPFFTRMANAITGVGSEQKKFDRPFGLSLDEAGNLVVTDTGMGAVFYLDFSRKKWQRWVTVGQQRLVSPVAAVHSGKTFFVADSALGEVIAFDDTGREQVAITNGLSRPAGLALLGDKLLIADSEQHEVIVCNTRGEVLSHFGRRGTGPGEFNFPTHVTTDARGLVYVTDSLNQRVQVFDGAGQFLRAFGSAGDGPGHFTRPKGVAVDSKGHVYVVDAVFGNVQIFNDQGRLLLDFGEIGSDAGQFSLPNAIAINARDEIFVADGFNHRVQMFRYTGRE
ncbi:MAG TPA: 6-bladed beta-propeller [Verrucomicrobiae bacterium]